MKNASGARIGEYWLDDEVPARSTEIAYRTTHRVLPRCARVAILNPAFLGVRLAEVQLMREACILEALCHAGVPRVFECGVLERRPWIATEFIDGVSIERAAADRPLSIGDALAIVRDAAAILAHAHARGLVHRNITPRLIIRTPGRSFPICLTEWGDASIHDNVIPHVVDPSARFYRAPELTAEGQGDGRVDVFALGAVMFEAATLVLPEPVQRFPGMPASFHQLLASMLTRAPEDRPTADAVHVEAARLAEVFTDAEGPIEEVEVELVDISRNPPPMPSLGWMPTNPLASLPGRALGTARRRRET
ncbi:MAG TPA: protein kinase [Kofleriaceae bacterium]|nr:protein kinase [Kofleriaceae bacterium]